MDQNKTTSFIPALGYDFLTAYYDMAIKLTMPEKKFRRILVESINPQDDESILEFGFGTGQNLILVKNQNPNIPYNWIYIAAICFHIRTIILTKYTVV